MSKLQQYEHAGNTEYSNDLNLSKEHKDNRLETQTTKAQTEVNKHTVDGGISDFFDNYDARSRNSINQLKQETRNRVFGVLDRSATNYVSSLNASSSAKLEKLAWNRYQDDVLNRIKNVNANTTSSISVIEGYKIFLAEAQKKTDAEWGKQKTANAQTMENFGRWDKFLKQKGYKKFEAAADDEIKTLFTELNENLNRVKSVAETRQEAMKTRIKTTWESTIDPATKATLWKEAVAAQKATNIASVNAPAFLGVTTEQNKIDFVEALASLNFLSEGLGATQKIGQKHQDQADLLKSCKEQQDLMAKASDFKFEEFRALEWISAFPANAENAPKTPALVAAIQKDLKKNGQNTEGYFDDDPKKDDLLTDSAKLVIYVQKLVSKGKSVKDLLSITTAQMLVDWIENQDISTKGSVEAYDGVATQKLMEKIRGKDGKDGWSKTIEGLAGSLEKIDSSDMDVDILTHYNTSLDIANEITLTLSTFEQNQKDYSEQDQAILRGILEEMKTVSTNLTEALSGWLDTKKEHSKWEKKLAAIEKSKTDTFSDTDAMHKEDATKNNKSLKSDVLHKRQDAVNAVTTIKKEEPTFAKIPNLEDLKNSLHAWKNTPYNLSDKIKGLTNGKSLDALIRENILDDFSDELEAKFIDKMSKNDQFDLLKKLPVGTKIKATTQAVGATEDIHFPNDLNGTEDEPFTIKQHFSDRQEIRLEGKGGKILTLFGAFAKDGQTFKNGIMKQKAKKDIMHTGVKTIAYNFKI